MGMLSQRVHDHVDALHWRRIWHLFVSVAEILLEFSPDARGELAGRYVKFTTGSQPTSRVYAAVWPKPSPPRRLIVGLALPEEFEAESLGPPPEPIFYRGITRFLVILEGRSIPEGLSRWAKEAYDHAVLLKGVNRHLSL
jgi:hypothetical protein